MRILLPIDGSSFSDAAVAEVARRPWPPGSEVRVIIVDPPFDAGLFRGGPPTALDELIDRQRVESGKHLAQAVEVLRQNAPQLTVHADVLEGWPKEALLDEAERWGADLIVVGSRGHGALKRFFLGSVSLALATNAPCSVEIVRAPARVSAGAASEPQAARRRDL